jgi:hypothetical protein
LTLQLPVATSKANLPQVASKIATLLHCIRLPRAIGASTYEFNQQAINSQPLGENASLSQTLLQAPGVAKDSFGQLHVRVDHANLQYRINGVIIPETISGFSELFGARFARRIDLLTGRMPQQ